MEYVEGLPNFKITHRSQAQPGLAEMARPDVHIYKAPITWRSKMQKTTALSMAEAEYFSQSAAGSDVLSLKGP
jgi:hypothetical protein